MTIQALHYKAQVLRLTPSNLSRVRLL